MKSFFCVQIGLRGKFTLLGLTRTWGATQVVQRICLQCTKVLLPGLGRSPGEGNGNPLQYSCLENPMDRGALWVHGVTKSQTLWSNYTIRTQQAQDIIFIIVDIIKYLLSGNPQKYWQEDWTPCSCSEGNWSGLVLIVKGRGRRGAQNTGALRWQLLPSWK